MSTDNLPVLPQPIAEPLSLRELITVMVKHYGIHEGYYDLLVEYNIGIGSFGPDPASQSPGAMIGISKVGLIKSEALRPTSVDASAVNPTQESTAKKKKK